MGPVEHIAADQALKAKKAAEGEHPPHLHMGRRAASAPSTASRVATAVLWLLAIGTLVALFLRR